MNPLKSRSFAMIHSLASLSEMILILRAENVPKACTILPCQGPRSDAHRYSVSVEGIEGDEAYRLAHGALGILLDAASRGVVERVDLIADPAHVGLHA